MSGLPDILPANAFIVVGVEMGESSRSHVRAAVGSFEGVAARDAHAPEHHPAGGEVAGYLDDVRAVLTGAEIPRGVRGAAAGGGR